MTDRSQVDFPEGPSRGRAPHVRRREPRTPVATLTFAMFVYIFVNLLWALPLLFSPQRFFSLILKGELVPGQFDGLRWFGAALLAWAVSGILVLARPEGRAIFVTTGALQLTFAGSLSLYTWYIDPDQWTLWYDIAGSSIFNIGAVYLWWARFRARAVLKSAQSKH